jgi:peroxiredoxin (alkyl hydroperoxide reductase subunit C)
MVWNPDSSFKEIKLSDFKGKYVVLFFYPLDFTYVCPTEIITFNSHAKEFKEVNCELIACSVDSSITHAEYTKKSRNKGGAGPLQFPLLSDLNKNISKDYGVLTRDGAISLRGTFIID